MATVILWMRLNVTLYAHCLFCFSSLISSVKTVITLTSILISKTPQVICSACVDKANVVRVTCFYRHWNVGCDCSKMWCHKLRGVNVCVCVNERERETKQSFLSWNMVQSASWKMGSDKSAVQKTLHRITKDFKLQSQGYGDCSFRSDNKFPWLFL